MIQRLFRILDDSIPLAGIALGTVMVIALLHRTTSTLVEVMSDSESAESEVARALADEVAHMVVLESRGARSHVSLMVRNDFECVASLSSHEAERVLEITVRRPNGKVHRYKSLVLPGAAPRALGASLALTEAQRDRVTDISSRFESGIARPMWLSKERFPRLDPTAANAPCVEGGSYGFRRDDSIALMRLRQGTDRKDYVFAADAKGLAHLHVPSRGVLRIPGNLWVDDKGPAITVEIDRALTVVVQGNLYLGQSLRVRGKGRLFLVVEQNEPSHTDLDLDGSWRGERVNASLHTSARIEGCGAFYIGLPSRPVLATRLQCDASVVCHGEAYLLADKARFAGSLVLGGGWLQRQLVVDLSFTAAQIVHVRRTRVPGFSVDGEPRPSLLHER